MMGILAEAAIKSGATLVGKILAQKLGDQDGNLATQVVVAIAKKAGVLPDDLETLHDQDPGKVLDAMRVVEREAPELVALYASEVQLQMAALQAEQGDPAWMRAWRPIWMYLLGFLWLWNLVLLHVLNAIFKIALPPQQLTDLLALTGLFLSLYMGGHTVLRALGKTGDK